VLLSGLEKALFKKLVFRFLFFKVFLCFNLQMPNTNRFYVKYDPQAHVMKGKDKLVSKDSAM